MLKRIRMDITDNCNLRCVMCTIHDYHQKDELHCFPFDVFKKHCQGFLSDLKYVQLGNIAEPLLHPSFEQFIQFIRSETNAEIQIQTNGTLLHKHLKTLHENRCTVNVSLDSFDQETYERIRVGSRYEQVINNLKEIDTDQTQVILTPVWMTCNIEKFDQFIGFCNDHHFKLAGNPICIRESRGVIQKSNIDESLWFNKAAIINWKKTYLNVSQDDTDLGRIFKSINSGKLDSFRCSAHHDDLMILADGTCNLCFQKNVGNLHQCTLKEIWSGEEATSFRKLVDQNLTDVCMECDYRSTCLNPFIENFRNHVSKGIYTSLPEAIRDELSFESDLSDGEQKALFIEGVKDSFHVVSVKKHGDLFYSIPLSYGDLDLTQEKNRKRPVIISAKTKWDLEQAILKDGLPPGTPVLLDSYKKYNRVHYRDLIYSVPHSLGPINLTSKENLSAPGILIASSRREAKRQIDQRDTIPSPAEKSPLCRESTGDEVVQEEGRPRASEDLSTPFSIRHRINNGRVRQEEVPTPRFSFLLPTRGRPKLVSRFFQSILETTGRVQDLEIILAVDEDDLESQNISHDQLTIKKITLPRGASMGALNRACFDASSGQYVMLVNDDIILRTKDWDKTVAAAFASFPDDIALIHVNDLLFREKLCTFPFLSRRTCLEIGICPAEYRRYRIDDHIYDIYNMLAYLGHKRILYLPDVVFEHENHTTEQIPSKDQIFRSLDNKIYSPNQEIIEQDARIFENKTEERKQGVMKLVRLIEEDQFTRRRSQKETIYSGLLAQIQDPFSYRRSDFVNKFSLKEGHVTKTTPKTTIAVVTSDFRNEHAVQCLSLIKKHTKNYELLILDNSKSKEFSHPREMNKVLRNVETDYLVLMDDDVFVEEEWLEGMIKAVDEETGVVAPLHKDKNGMLSFSGAYLAGDGLGTHEHTFDRPDRPREMQVYCSAILLIDMKKCGHIFMDETYKKYFFDLVHGLEVWEAGFKTVCTPEVAVVHAGGATMKWGSQEANQLLKSDRARFIQHWVQTGRLARLEQGIWQRFPYLKNLVEIPQRIQRVFEVADQRSLDEYKKEVEPLLHASRNYTLFKQDIGKRLQKSIPLLVQKGDARREQFCKEALKKMKDLSREENWIPGEKAKKPPVVSALVSTYCAERFMRGLLEDLEGQTIADRMEIVIVDSNSPQNEGAIVREFQKRYDNIVYLRTPERENSHVAFNRCIELARGKYVTLACTDDRHRKDALERMVEVLETHSDVALVYGDVAITDRENETFEKARVRGHYRWPDFDPKLLFQIDYIGPQPVWRRELHDRYGYFDPELWSAGDYEFWLRLACREKFFHIPEVLGLYYLSSNSNEHKNMSLSFQESEKARERYWPREWGPCPTPFFNKNPFADSEASADSGNGLKERVLLLKQQGITFYNWGDQSGAENAFKQALAIDPRNADVLVSMGKLCYESKRQQEALTYLRRAIQENPGDKDAHIGIALAAYEMNDLPACQTAYEKARRLDPSHPVVKSLDRLFASKKRSVTPKKEKAASGDIHDPKPFNDLGESFFNEGKVEEAKEQFLKSQAVDEHYLPALNNLGVVSFQQGDLERAMEYFRRVLSLDPSFRDAAENLEKCLEARNNLHRKGQTVTEEIIAEAR